VSLKMKTISKYIHLNRMLLVFAIGVVFLFVPMDLLSRIAPKCLFHTLFSTGCIGCGTTRAILSVLHLRFIEAYEYNRLIVVIFPLMIGCLIRWIVKGSDGTLAGNIRR